MEPQAKGRQHWRTLIVLYAVLLLASSVVVQLRWGSTDTATLAARARLHDQRLIVIDDANGSVGIAVRMWPAKHARARGLDCRPLLLLHGAPGDGAAFMQMAERLSENRDVLAPDLPGFGNSSMRYVGGTRADLSTRANAQRMLSLLDALGIARAHVVGWSNGGATGLAMADSHPDRVVSLTLLASVGVQEHEGSGSYVIEHLKYRAGMGMMAMAGLIPHFGLLGSFDQRVGWLRNFGDGDQRELRGQMQRIEAAARVPVFLLHGAHDPLVPLRAAVETRALMPTCRMLVTDASHFIPFMQAAPTADVISEFADEIDGVWSAAASQPGEWPLPAPGSRIDRWDYTPRAGVLGSVDWARERVWRAGWLAGLVGMLVLIAWNPALGVAVLGALVVGSAVDPFVALLSLLGGVTLRSVVSLRRGVRRAQRDDTSAIAHDWTRRLTWQPWTQGWRAGVLHAWRDDAMQGLGAAIAARTASPLRLTCIVLAGVATMTGLLAWSLVTLVAACVGMAVVEHEITPRAHGLAAVLGFVLFIAALVKVGWPSVRWANVLSVRGWRFLRIGWDRLTQREYWPSWAWYVLIGPGLLWLAMKHRTILAWLAANPGVPMGGGWVGESKWAILERLSNRSGWGGGSTRVANTAVVADGTDIAARAASVEQFAEEKLQGRWPVILKPDIGERGFSVKLCRSRTDAEAYFARVRGDVIVQQYHPGPNECGILWARRLDRAGEHPHCGFIYSITAKEFPVITGDGQHTLEELIEQHPRLRRQHRVFLARHAANASRVLALGEHVALSMAGNHCQGTKFFDGSHLRSAALEEAVDAIARAYGAATGQPDSLDFARFDVRYESDDLLREGKGFVIVEMNGTSAESTNIYDPGRSLWWAMGVLLGQWALLTRLGLWRVERGAPRPTWRDLWTIMRDARRAQRRRGGTALSD